LTIKQILKWADEHRRRTGRWPSPYSGPIADTMDESWINVQSALFVGLRGLPGSSSLAKLLRKHRGHPAGHNSQTLTIEKILAWADAHHRRTGAWPDYKSGVVVGVPGEKWSTINAALRRGLRGLKCGTYLAEVLWQYRSVASQLHRPDFTVDQILQWADAYHETTGEWPTYATGIIPGTPGVTWNLIRESLLSGCHGLPAGLTLNKLLKKRRGVLHGNYRPLTVEEVLTWADNHHRKTGRWPKSNSGPVLDARAETWRRIDNALSIGIRGLPRCRSLANLLAKHRGISPNAGRPFLTDAAILSWAEAFHRRTGTWPRSTSGPIPESPGETWAAVAAALYTGGRGLKKGRSLAKLLAKHLAAPARVDRRPPLSVKQVVGWIKDYRRRTGRWPSSVDEPITNAPRETWRRLDYVLRKGRRGLPGGLSLGQFAVKFCGRPER
jgi:hypothetical protein